MPAGPSWVERDLEQPGIPLDLREEQAALQHGERGQVHHSFLGPFGLPDDSGQR